MLAGQPGPFQLWEMDRHGWHVPSTAMWNCSTEMTVRPCHLSPHVFFRENGNSSVLMLLTTLVPLPDTATSRTMRGRESLGLLWGLIHHVALSCQKQNKNLASNQNPTTRPMNWSIWQCKRPPGGNFWHLKWLYPALQGGEHPLTSSLALCIHYWREHIRYAHIFWDRVSYVGQAGLTHPLLLLRVLRLKVHPTAWPSRSKKNNLSWVSYTCYYLSQNLGVRGQADFGKFKASQDYTVRHCLQKGRGRTH